MQETDDINALTLCRSLTHLVSELWYAFGTQISGAYSGGPSPLRFAFAGRFPLGDQCAWVSRVDDAMVIKVPEFLVSGSRMTNSAGTGAIAAAGRLASPRGVIN